MILEFCVDGYVVVFDTFSGFTSSACILYVFVISVLWIVDSVKVSFRLSYRLNY